MAFDAQRAVVATGDGIVARFPGILCVAAGEDPEAVRQLLTLCAGAAGPDPGRALARRLATWMSGPDAPGDDLRFGTLAAAGDRLAVFLVGEVEAWVDGAGDTALTGAHAAIGTDRLLPRPGEPVVLSLGEVRLPPDPSDVHDLRVGVVVGAGVVLHPPRPTVHEVPPQRAVADVPEPEAAATDHDWFATAQFPAAGEEPATAGRGGDHAAGRNGTASAHAGEEPAGGPARSGGARPGRGAASRGTAGLLAASVVASDLADPDAARAGSADVLAGDGAGPAGSRGGGGDLAEADGDRTSDGGAVAGDPDRPAERLAADHAADHQAAAPDGDDHPDADRAADGALRVGETGADEIRADENRADEIRADERSGPTRTGPTRTGPADPGPAATGRARTRP